MAAQLSRTSSSPPSPKQVKEASEYIRRLLETTKRNAATSDVKKKYADRIKQLDAYRYPYKTVSSTAKRGPCDAICAEADAALTVWVNAVIEVLAAQLVESAASMIYLEKSAACMNCQMENP